MVTGLESRNQPVQLPNKHLAIYLIHGTADQSSGCERLAQLLRQQLPSFCDIITPDFYDCSTGSKVVDFAENLRAQCSQAKAKDAVFIGHSRGGLVAAHMALKLAPSAGIAVHQLECVVSPFQGSEWANHFSTGHQLLRSLPLVSRALPEQLYLDEMAVDSNYLRELCAELNQAIAENRLNAHFHGAREDFIVDWRHTHPMGKLADEEARWPANFHMTETSHCHLSQMTSNAMADGIAERIRALPKFQELDAYHAAENHRQRCSLASFQW